MIPKVDRVPEPGREGQRKLTVTRSDIAGLPVGADFTAEVIYDDGATIEGTPVNKASEIEYLAASGTTTGTAAVFNLAQEGFALFDGALVRAKFHINTTAPFTLNVNSTGVIPVYDAQGGNSANYNANTWGTFVYSQTLNRWIAQGAGAQVIDNLTSTSTTAALSANQGRILNGNIPAATIVVDNLTSTSTTAALSANQGRILNEKSPATISVIDDLTSTSTTAALSANQGRVINNKLIANPLKLGLNSSASGNNSIAMGYNSNAMGYYSVALGALSNAPGVDSIALGYTSKGFGDDSIALGYNSYAPGVGSVALGTHSVAGHNSIAMGYNSNAMGNNSVALGAFSNASGNNSTAMGYNSSASGNDSIALGYNSYASEFFSIALGYNSSASGFRSTALGYNSTIVSTEANYMQLGDANLSVLRCAVQLTVSSDIRDKAEVEPIQNALDLILSLEPIRYVHNFRDHYLLDDVDENTQELRNKYGLAGYDLESHASGIKKGSRKRVGLSAQQVEKAMLELFGTDNYADIVTDNLHDVGEVPEGVESKKTVTYTAFIPFLISAMQELAKRLEKLEGQNG